MLCHSDKTTKNSNMAEPIECKALVAFGVNDIREETIIVNFRFLL